MLIDKIPAGTYCEIEVKTSENVGNEISHKDIDSLSSFNMRRLSNYKKFNTFRKC